MREGTAFKHAPRSISHHISSLLCPFQFQLTFHAHDFHVFQTLKQRWLSLCLEKLSLSLSEPHVSHLLILILSNNPGIQFAWVNRITFQAHVPLLSLWTESGRIMVSAEIGLRANYFSCGRTSSKQRACIGWFWLQSGRANSLLCPLVYGFLPLPATFAWLVAGTNFGFGGKWCRIQFEHCSMSNGWKQGTRPECRNSALFIKEITDWASEMEHAVYQTN